jgi:hypothetical protein
MLADMMTQVCQMAEAIGSAPLADAARRAAKVMQDDVAADSGGEEHLCIIGRSLAGAPQIVRIGELIDAAMVIEIANSIREPGAYVFIFETDAGKFILDTLSRESQLEVLGAIRSRCQVPPAVWTEEMGMPADLPNPDQPSFAASLRFRGAEEALPPGGPELVPPAGLAERMPVESIPKEVYGQPLTGIIMRRNRTPLFEFSGTVLLDPESGAVYRPAGFPVGAPAAPKPS